MKYLLIEENRSGLLEHTPDTINEIPKTRITEYLLNNFLTMDHDRTCLFTWGGTKGLFRLIDYPRLLESGYKITPVMGLSDIKAIKISLPKSGKEESKRSEDKLIWYLRDLEILSGLARRDFLKAFPSKTVYGSIQTFSDLLNGHFEVDITKSPTLAGLSLSAFRKHLKAQDKKLEGVSGRARKVCEESYFGGHTYCFNIIPHENEVGIDSNSHYAAVMLKYPMPSGEPFFLPPDEPYQEDDLVLATVDIPEGTFPTLKCRLGDMTAGDRPLEIKKVGTGRISGWFWGFELGFQVKQGSSAHVWEIMRFPGRSSDLQSFVEKVRSLRMSDYDGPLGQTAKLLQNALYGKFAQRPSATETILSLSNPGGDAWPVDFPGKLSRVLPGYLWMRPAQYLLGGADMIHWGSYITARARFELASTIDLIGWENVDYADTDSIFTETQFLSGPIERLAGSDYGQWKVLGTYCYWQASAPKAYRWLDKDLIPGRKEKGLDRDKAALALDGEEIKTAQIPSLRQVLFKQMAAESEERIFRTSDPRHPGGRYDQDGFWIPDHLSQNIAEFLARKKLDSFTKNWLVRMMEDYPGLFSDIPPPTRQKREAFDNAEWEEKMQRWIERVWEKRHEWAIAHKKDDPQRDREVIPLVEY